MHTKWYDDVCSKFQGQKKLFLPRKNVEYKIQSDAVDPGGSDFFFFFNR